MGKVVGVLRPRIEGSDPIQKWINLVNRWNQYVRRGVFKTESNFQAMYITLGEVKDLFKQYPDLLCDLRMVGGLCAGAQDQLYLREILEYVEYDFRYSIPEILPIPQKFNERELVDISLIYG